MALTAAEKKARKTVRDANAAAPDEAPTLTKEEIRANAERNRSKPDWVWIEEWGSRVTIKRLDAGEHEQAIEFAHAGGEHSQYRQALKSIELGCVEPSFDLDDDDDWALLKGSDPGTLFALYAGISILSNLRDGRVADFQRQFPGPGREPVLDAASGAAPDREGEGTVPDGDARTDE